MSIKEAPATLRLLLVDDNPDDRALVVHELSRIFPVLDAQQIFDEIGYAAAVNAAAFDLVITDYQLRWTNGLRILRDLKNRGVKCPVIMFTGTGSEEIAVEAMKNGLCTH